MPLKKSGLNYPNKMAYIYMTSIEEEIGSKAMAAALKLAELPQFIDNYPPNLPAAEKMGIRTILFTSPAQLRKDLKEIGIEA